MARIVQIEEFGGPEVLRVVDADLPGPGPGEVRLEVRAAALNPADLKSRSGLFGGQLPKRLGSEAAGVVAAVGPDVTSVAVGDEVIAFPATGAHASELVLPADSLTPKPPSLGWEEAAGLMLTGAAAVHALTAAGVGDGDRVLVHGAAGGVGQMAVQLARLRGARVIGTTDPSGDEVLRGLGAEPVRYGDGLADRVRALAPDGVTAALDLVGSDEALDVSLELVGDPDRIATIANFDRGPSAGVKVLGAGPGGDPGTEVRNAARAELARLAGEGRLRVSVMARFPLDDVAEAHRLLAEGRATGKVVLLP